jgi:hypothetical protein
MFNLWERMSLFTASMPEGLNVQPLFLLNQTFSLQFPDHQVGYGVRWKCLSCSFPCVYCGPIWAAISGQFFTSLSFNACR